MISLMVLQNSSVTALCIQTELPFRLHELQVFLCTPVQSCPSLTSCCLLVSVLVSPPASPPLKAHRIGNTIFGQGELFLSLNFLPLFSKRSIKMLFLAQN